MARKTLTDLFGASCTYNATTGFLSFKVTELASTIVVPVTPQKIIAGLLKKNALLLTVVNRTTNPDESIIIESLERNFSPASTIGVYEIRETWVVTGYSSDNSSTTANSY